MRAARAASIRCLQAVGKRHLYSQPENLQQMPSKMYSSMTNIQRPLRFQTPNLRPLYFHGSNYNGRFLFRSFTTAKPLGTDSDEGMNDPSNANWILSPSQEDGNTFASRIAVRPTSRGYAFEVLLRLNPDQQQQQQQQHRQFSQSSTGSDTIYPGPATDDGTIYAPGDKVKRRQRKRLAVYYPFNDRDIKRKQFKRKEEARERTIFNVKRALLGNVVIAGSKLAAWFCSQSSSMMSEFIHSVVDCANQYLLLQGLKDSSNEPDRKHPYGYGKSVYFWALCSALGTFFMGFGLSMSHAWGELMNPSLHAIGPEVLGVLSFSFAVDGYVLYKTITEIREGLPEGKSFWWAVTNMRDPATLAILLEDGAACFGVVMALAGTTASHVTGSPIYDGIAGCGISILLGTMGLTLARMNYRFLLGQAVDKDITDSIESILKSRKSIDAVSSVQSQWTGPDTFSYKAEVGFDGTFLAAKLMPTHEKEFYAIRDTMEKDLALVLSWYAEDVIRTVEREVRIIEAQVRRKFPAAEYIELEPMSKDSHEFAIDDSFEKELVRIETETLESFRQMLPALERHEGGSASEGGPPIPGITPLGSLSDDALIPREASSDNALTRKEEAEGSKDK